LNELSWSTSTGPYAAIVPRLNEAWESSLIGRLQGSTATGSARARGGAAALPTVPLPGIRRVRWHAARTQERADASPALGAPGEALPFALPQGQHP
jgi:hypothetical protein